MRNSSFQNVQGMATILHWRELALSRSKASLMGHRFCHAQMA
jgi:hypothetical protein